MVVVNEMLSALTDRMLQRTVEEIFYECAPRQIEVLTSRPSDDDVRVRYTFERKDGAAQTTEVPIGFVHTLEDFATVVGIISRNARREFARANGYYF